MGLLICLPLCLPVCSHSQVFLGWAGLDGVRVLRNSSPIIPHCLARSLHYSQHVHTYINTHVYMRTHSCSSWKSGVSFCVAWQLRHSSVSSVRQGLSVCLSTFTCTHETQLLQGIRIRQGCNSMCLYQDLFILVSAVGLFIILDTGTHKECVMHCSHIDVF